MKTEAEWQAMEREIRQMKRRLREINKRVVAYEIVKRDLNEQLKKLG